jgi:hypothetical protein
MDYLNGVIIIISLLCYARCAFLNYRINKLYVDFMDLSERYSSDYSELVNSFQELCKEAANKNASTEKSDGISNETIAAK